MVRNLSIATALLALATPRCAPAQARRTVSFDQHSLLIDGKRTYIWSGEFHYWRLPSPALWRDVLEKYKASGLNAVSIYFDWGYHSPKPGVYDFTGVRDVEKLLRIAEDVGLYVISRQGPYINAEASAGGYPGWLTTQAGRARSDAPDYLAASDEWLTRIDAILARHQLADGRGTIIAYQIENELSAVAPAQQRYMQHLHDKARADGIAVPIFHNDIGRNGRWVPPGANVPRTIVGPVDLYAFDGYPGGECRNDGTPGDPSAAPDWGMWGRGGANGGASASPNTPGFVAEFGGGWFDHWGSVGKYPCTAVRQGPGYERVFYETNIANGITLQNFYMVFGGTSWGWIPAPVVYTSYDYGAAIDEARQLRPKATALKAIGLFLQSVSPVTDLTKGEAVTPSSPAVKVYHDVSVSSGTHLYVVMHNPSSATTDDTLTFGIATRDGSYRVPRVGTLRVNGQDAKLLVADYAMEHQHLVYSTSEMLTHLSRGDGGDGDLAVLHGRQGERGETVLRYSSRPTVATLAGHVDASFDATTGDLRLDYAHDGVAEIRVTGGGRPPLTLVIIDEGNTASFWRNDTDAGAVLARGPALVRDARVVGATVHLAGDTKETSPLEVWAPSRVRAVTWNGAPVTVRHSASGALVATRMLPGAATIHLPDLANARWRVAPGSPEAAPAFDDHDWTPADKRTTNSTTKPDSGQPVLTADDYGFHQGDVWYRARFAGAVPRGVRLRFGGGGAGLLQAWLDGVYLGQHVLPSNGVARPPTVGVASFAIPDSIRGDRAHVLAVMVRNDGHNEDGGANDAHKEGRGLIAVAFGDSAGADERHQPMNLTWRIQGNAGGEDIADRVRGVMNNGGLYGERHGWHLPSYADTGWQTATLPAATATPGTTWYRTTFDLHIPKDHDASLGITIGDAQAPHSSANYRALVFVNGWNMGQYIANVGPQHTFVVPTGVLDPRGRNTIAIAVTSDGGPGNGLEAVLLTNLGTVRGGIPFRAATPATGAPRDRRPQSARASP